MRSIPWREVNSQYFAEPLFSKLLSLLIAASTDRVERNGRSGPSCRRLPYRLPDSDCSLNKLAKNSKRNHDRAVRIQNRLGRLCGSSVRCASVALTLALCASAFAADPGKNVVLPAQPQRGVKTVKKLCYTFTSTSGIPVPCERLRPIPTTASPMTIYRQATAK